MVIVLVDRGPHQLHENAVGMIAGAVGMVAYAATVIHLLRRMRAWAATIIALLAWLTVAALAATPLLLG